MTYPEFEARWKPAGGAERANYGLFLQDLCDLLEVPRPDPTTDNPAQDQYVLERAVQFNDGQKKSTGRIDLYKRGCFVLETKQGTDTPDQQQKLDRAELGLPSEKRRKGHAVRNSAKWAEMMQAARQQALGYVRALPPEEPRPLFVLVADVGYCLDVYSNFAGVGDSFVPFPDQTRFRLPLSALADEGTRAMLRQVFLAPRDLDPSRRAARVTRELAARLAKLSEQLERAGHAPEVVAQFLMRCLFTMFSEDVGLIPKTSFTGMLGQYRTPELLEFLPDALTNLWRTMDTGGFSPDLKARLRRFNGKLFHDATALPLTADQAELLLQSARADWTEVEPAIFGTLLERALDPKERHSLGAHYTPRRYVERLVLPTVLEPLRREWAAAQAAGARRLEEGNPKEARQELVRFLSRLTSIRILDPACGSGNFLYVTLEHLKRLEGEVLAAINSYGHTGLLELGGGTTVSPHQLLGLELNPRAAAIADVVLRIGYLQWHLRTYGPSELREPLLDEYQNIRQQDAALQHDAPVPRLDALGHPVTRWDGTTRLHPATGQPVPDETARTPVLDYPNPKPAEWPTADFIVGNPPFLGDKAMRRALGDGYVDALRKAYKGTVPDSADLVMYWWRKAAECVQQRRTERFGFITTNSISQGFNRRVIQPFIENSEAPLSLIFAIPNHPWVDNGNGAAVRIAMTAVEAGEKPGQLLTVVDEQLADDGSSEVEFAQQDGIINADLRVGADIDSASTLKSNKSIANVGFGLYGSGFLVEQAQAETLGLGEIIGLEKRIRPYLNGRDLAQRSRGMLAIDLYGMTTNDVMTTYPKVYQHVFERVKPERDSNNRASRREKWWLFGEPNPRLREALNGLPRFVATTRVSRQRFFVFLEDAVLPDEKIVVFATDDAYHLGVLSSTVHITWALAAGSRLGVGNDPVYDKSRCFDPFPFPAATAEQQARIRELAEQLDAHRKRQQALHPSLTLTDLYNVVEKLRAGTALSTAKEQTINQQGLASVVLSLHQQLDAAVAEAYNWPTALPDAEILQRLVRLNHERACEEQAGLIRYLRPAYQAPELQQQHLELPTAAKAAAATATAQEATGPQPWPTELAQQMQALRDVVQQAAQPVSAAQVAARFRHLKPEKVQPLLDTLTALSLLRRTEEATYAA
ncbi:Type II restriction/modification system, DNA methylase subunit YeeA [Hymenobacter gelipurpurascens]|uniref:site-specific DNA-methyltransferase (adenine-specific) n=1 Tax=Hymenobacter gelipurpurascens TaxID=89968 RepID=A0A212TJN0_9BACT|nr:DNA methyltransferase [Hymenobacter gelipurpurascens]SNC66046.1 Type II restriction/modification system, DNA methylase subunit YeeA [Hymenobacter gelipurpurascens]